jgi:hypothetical protein
MRQGGAGMCAEFPRAADRWVSTISRHEQPTKTMLETAVGEERTEQLGFELPDRRRTREAASARSA